MIRLTVNERSLSQVRSKPSRMNSSMTPSARLIASPYVIPTTMAEGRVRPWLRLKATPEIAPRATTTASICSFLSILAFMTTLHPATRSLIASPIDLVECLAQGDIALLLSGPVAAAGDRAVDHEIVPVDEGRLVAGQKHRRMRDIVGQAGAGDRLRTLVDLAHHVRGFLGRLHRQA